MNVERLPLLYPKPSVAEIEQLTVLKACVLAAKSAARNDRHRWPLNEVPVTIDEVRRELAFSGALNTPVHVLIDVLLTIESQHSYLTLEDGFGAIRLNNHLFKELAQAWHIKMVACGVCANISKVCRGCQSKETISISCRSAIGRICKACGRFQPKGLPLLAMAS